MKKFLILLLLLPLQFLAQEVPNSVQFMNTLKEHCGKAYEGKIVAGGKEGDGFTGEKLVMHVLSCDNDEVRIPFFVGDDKSRTWVFTLNEDSLLTLKHDHRKKDGSDDEITQYGGTNSNIGLADNQVFPADQFTSDLISYASTNVWWVTVNETSFTYNLRRIGSDRYFSVSFDLSKEIETPGKPWGHKE